MKITFIVIATILLLAKGVYSQSKTERITDIDKICQEIKSNLDSYTKTEKAKDNSGYKYGYTLSGELKQITIFFKDQNIDKYVFWCFHQGQLIYSEQIWTDRSTNKIVDNEKLYLNNEQLFAWFKSDKPVDINSQDFKNAATEMTAFVGKLKTD